MWVTTSNFRLVRINFATRTVVPGYDWATASALSIRDPRAVEVVGNQLFICDGYDSYSSTNQARYAIRSFSITGTGGGGGVAPVASFTSSPGAPTTATPVSFVDSSTGSPTSWLWSFGDGTASSVQSPQHTFAASGTYTVTLTVSNASGSNSTSRTVTVAAAGGGGAPVTTRFLAVEDAMVKSSSATTNYGTYAYVSAAVQSGTTYRGYIKFDVTGLTGTVINAKLRVHAWDGSVDSGTWYTAPSTWSESTLNWNTAPPVTGSPINAATSAVSTGSWTETTVTGVIAGNGTITFALTSTNADRIYYSSGETAQVPELVITTQ
jgi:PKD repeat protein